MNIGQFAVANLSEGYFKIRRHLNRAEGLGESGIRKGRVHAVTVGLFMAIERVT